MGEIDKMYLHSTPAYLEISTEVQLQLAAYILDNPVTRDAYLVRIYGNSGRLFAGDSARKWCLSSPRNFPAEVETTRIKSLVSLKAARPTKPEVDRYWGTIALAASGQVD